MKKELTPTTTKGELLQDENDKLKRLLHDLTPGGSEFYNDPEYCAKWVRESRQQHHYSLARQIVNLKNERQKLLDSNQKLLDALEQANKMMWDLRHSYCENEDGYLKDDAQGWDAEVDILVSETIKNAKNIQP